MTAFRLGSRPFGGGGGTRIALRRFRSPGLRCGYFGRPAAKRTAPSSRGSPDGGMQSFWQALRYKIFCEGSAQDDCGAVRFAHPSPDGHAAALGKPTNFCKEAPRKTCSAIRFGGGRPKHPQCSPGDRNLRNAIRAPAFFSERAMPERPHSVQAPIHDCMAQWRTAGWAELVSDTNAAARSHSENRTRLASSKYIVAPRLEGPLRKS